MVIIRWMITGLSGDAESNMSGSTPFMISFILVGATKPLSPLVRNSINLSIIALIFPGMAPSEFRPHGGDGKRIADSGIPRNMDRNARLRSVVEKGDDKRETARRTNAALFGIY
jgi:hypothetical protein